MINGTETILIKRKEFLADDGYGNPVETEQEIVVNGALVAWGGTSTDYGTERTLITSAATVYLPQGTEIMDSDVFIVRGKRYRKDGEAQEWQPPAHFRVKTGVVVALTRAEG